MAERPGAVGRKTSPDIGTYEDLHDPANGEKVTRCAVCGKPTPTFIIGKWSGDGRVYRAYICDWCITNETRPKGPMDSDSLRVDEPQIFLR